MGLLFPSIWSEALTVKSFNPSLCFKVCDSAMLEGPAPTMMTSASNILPHRRIWSPRYDLEKRLTSFKFEITATV
jgi:hypothetical protein